MQYNILFLTLGNIDLNERNLYTEFINAISKNNINIFIVSPNEKRKGLPDDLIEHKNIKILKVKTGNITKSSNIIEKGISTLKLQRQYIKAIKKYFSDIDFDMVVYSTPPITFDKVIKYMKRKHNSSSYLMLKDIFPQNAVDLGMFSKKSLVYKYFRKKEKILYEHSDFIGCMSQGNINYLLENNNINPNKVELFPNAIIPKDICKTSGRSYLLKYGVPEGKTLFVYGGNIGVPQGIEYIKEVVSKFNQVHSSFLLIVGSGAKFNELKDTIEMNDIRNVKVLNRLPKDEYDELLKVADVGLVFLDYRFTIPNIPSRLTAYMEHSLPTLAATDPNTDLKDILYESGSGYWTESNNVEKFITLANTLASDKQKRIEMGKLGRSYLEKNYDVRKNVKTILAHLKKDD
ncbi:glycosyltransferase family 4 protein [Alkalibacillus salilacus]|uniref:Glycosyltransferase involved in cell wall biosynthesis n=1 Tax=Alkalibacillus salilacus TaxID=284582 RepID=A0ABT9VHW5_9BACI|nr:glycosyltransferase family 4 protein [Alkalibacillus salilacus]MDQ0160553.1 glycosyltransferase involved in cell wall biosynthesis [Alkalibacillus salilacus]